MIIHSKKRSFGKACHVSLFTLGTMRATENLDKMSQLIKSAHDAGINHLETAAAYGNAEKLIGESLKELETCLLYTSPSPRDLSTSRMPSSA